MVDLKVDEQMYDGAEPLNGFGGKVVQGVHAIGPHGCRALIEDSEGNPMALHSTEEA